MNAVLAPPGAGNPDYIPASLLTALGDIAVRGSSTVVRHPAGVNGQVMTSDSTAARGVKWAAAAGSHLSNVVDLSDFAPGDGTNQRVRVQNCIDSLGGKSAYIWVPSGDYVIESPGVDSSGIGSLTVCGPGFAHGAATGSGTVGALFRSPNNTTGYTMWTHIGTGDANDSGITFSNVNWLDPYDQQHNIASSGGVYNSGSATITFTTTSSHSFGIGDAVWTRNNTNKGYNGRWIVANTPAPDSTHFSVASPWNPGAFTGTNGQVAREPKVTALKIRSALRWLVHRCAFNQMRYGLNITTPADPTDDASWGHASDNVFDFCDVGALYDGVGNWSTTVSGGNCRLGDDQVGYWFKPGSHQRIESLKVDTSMPSGGGNATVGERTIGVLFENNDSFHANNIDCEMEGDSITVCSGTGTYTPSWSANVGGSTSWTRTSGGTVNTLGGTAGSYTGEIAGLGGQHNDTNDGRAIVIKGNGRVDIVAPQFHGTGFRTCIEIGGSTNGCNVTGGHDQIGLDAHHGVDILAGATNTVITAFHRTNAGTPTNHVVNSSDTSNKLVAVAKGPTTAPVTANA